MFSPTLHAALCMLCDPQRQPAHLCEECAVALPLLQLLSLLVEQQANANSCQCSDSACANFDRQQPKEAVRACRSELDGAHTHFHSWSTSTYEAEEASLPLLLLRSLRL